MDLIRSAYNGRMRFKEGGPSVPVRWFFAAKDAVVFESPTIFRSSDWEPTPHQNNGLGPQYPPRGSWRNGQRPSRVNGKVSCSSFHPTWWRHGIPRRTTVNVPRLTNGVPVCCAPSQLGFAFDGSARVRKGRLIGPPRGLLFGGTYTMPALYKRTILTNPTPGSTYTNTFTTQPWTLRINATLQAPGGGGGGALGGSSTLSAAGGGSSGGSFTGSQYGIGFSTGYTYQLGGGGAGGLAGSNNGNDGTDDCELDLPVPWTAPKGKGGQGGIAVPFGTGTVIRHSGGHVNGGNDGEPGYVIPGVSGNTAVSGAGGGSVTTGGGGDRLYTAGTGNSADPASGGGGGGAYASTSSETGGNGDDGFILIEEFNW